MTVRQRTIIREWEWEREREGERGTTRKWRTSFRKSDIPVKRQMSMEGSGFAIGREVIFGGCEHAARVTWHYWRGRGIGMGMGMGWNCRWRKAWECVG